MSDQQENCPKCGESASVVGKIGCPDEMLGHLPDGNSCLRRQLATANSRHRAWTGAFETTQLTHAMAKLDAAKTRTRLAEAKADRYREALQSIASILVAGTVADIARTALKE